MENELRHSLSTETLEEFVDVTVSLSQQHIELSLSAVSLINLPCTFKS